MCLVFPSDGSNSDLLQTIRVPVMADKKCQRAYRKVGPVSNRMICAGWDHGGMGPCVVSGLVGCLVRCFKEYTLYE